MPPKLLRRIAKLSAPRAFISHASEDHDFVEHLATRLRQDHGIDAWVDNWEMLPGDSLVSKVFAEGIGIKKVIKKLIKN